MKRVLLLALLIPAITHAAKIDTQMKQWIGATREQVTNAWGYPIYADHVVRLGDVTVFTYEFGLAETFRFGSFGSNGPCRIAFVFKDKKVVQNRWEGKFCPKLEPPK